jgi:hypothetical protein
MIDVIIPQLNLSFCMGSSVYALKSDTFVVPLGNVNKISSFLSFACSQDRVLRFPDCAIEVCIPPFWMTITEEAKQ